MQCGAIGKRGDGEMGGSISEGAGVVRLMSFIMNAFVSV